MTLTDPRGTTREGRAWTADDNVVPPPDKAVPPYLHAFFYRWQEEASRFEAIEGTARANLLIWLILADLTEALTTVSERLLTLQEAAVESGYSKAHLSRLVREGTVPDHRPHGGRGRLSFRKAELPIKPGRLPGNLDDLKGLEDLYGARPMKGRSVEGVRKVSGVPRGTG